jgi:virulence-associated protein VagC
MTRPKKISSGKLEGRQRARVFWSGRSQAVRLPKAFRFSTKEVAIRQEGRSVVLEPVEIKRDEKGWPEAWWSLAGSAPEFDIGDRQASHERGDVLAGRAE